MNPEEYSDTSRYNGSVEPWVCPNCKTRCTGEYCPVCSYAKRDQPKKSTGGMLAWSIVTLLVCTIPGIVAIVKTNKASSAANAAEQAPYYKSAKIWNIVGCAIGLISIALCIAAFGFYSSGESTDKTVSAIEEEAEQAPEQVSGEEYLENARSFLEEKDYIGAMEELSICEALYDDAGITEEADKLLEQIKTELAPIEPETGELERTIQYQGGGEFDVTASSGPAIITVTSASDEAAYSRFYIRQGEMAKVRFPAGSYLVSIEYGFVWFGEEEEFGGFSSQQDLDEPLVFKYSEDNAWITNSVWELTV